MIINVTRVIIKLAGLFYLEPQADLALAEPEKPRLSVDFPVTFKKYIAEEWKADTVVSDRMRKGYMELEKMCFTHLLTVRGDNYCAIRATLFQAFSVEKLADCPFLADMVSPVQVQENVQLMFEQYPYLDNWSFANKIEFQDLGCPMEVLRLCIGNLAFEVEQVRERTRINRIIYFFQKLNSKEKVKLFDFSLMEAIKFYMFVKSAEYWEVLQSGGDLPSGMEYFFLRETSLSLEQFLYNHLNNVGDVGGLEMIEMFLLGYTLGLQIQVTRISSFGKEDFITHYPPGHYPKERIINISAEDDRHYNVITTLNDEEEFLISSTLLNI